MTVNRYLACIFCGFLLTFLQTFADPLPKGVFVDSTSDLQFSQYPSVRFLTPDTAELVWATPSSTSAEVRVGASPNKLTRVGSLSAKPRHSFIMKKLPPNGKVYYQIIAGGKKSIPYPLETIGNFSPPRLSGASPSKDGKLAASYLKAASAKQPGFQKRGYCVVMNGSANLLLELARQSEMTVVGFFLDEQDAAKARMHLYRHKAYGSRVHVYALPHYGALPIRSNFANLVIRKKGANPIEKPAKVAPRGVPTVFPDKPKLCWLFRRDCRNANGSFTALQGGLKATPTGKGDVKSINNIQGYQLNGRSHLNISSGKVKDGLPTKEMTVEAWVQVNRPLQWGGIVGAFQDNGSYEKGWLLGYQGSSFSFAVKGSKGSKLTYLKEPGTFKAGKWSHVVGTYDGATMELYVNGKSVASSTAQSGPIDYAPDNFFDIGCYHDKDEKNDMTGAVHEIRIYHHVLTATDIARRYKSKSSLFPQPDKSGVTEAKRILQPGGILITHPGSPSIQVKPFLTGVGAWTHQYATSANTACSGEELSGATAVTDLTTQWLGWPGGNFGVDRNPRTPAPLTVDGRLFHQGMGRIAALDAYNGAVLWNLEIPDLRRFNIPRDSGNWCTARGRDLYVVVKDQLWQIASQTGKVRRSVPVGLKNHDWSYIACAGDMLYLSTLRKGGTYTGWWGGANWYDKGNSASTGKVVSDSIVGMDPDCKRKWTYKSKAIINPTITIDKGRIYFVDSNKPGLKGSRIASGDLDEISLVALDATSGRKLWDKKLNIVPGDIIFYGQSCSEGVVLTTSAKNDYHIYLFDHNSGDQKWHATHKWPANNHSGHMMHPVIVGGRIYLEPYGYTLKDGKRLKGKIGGRSGCHTYLACANALIYRGSGRQLAMWGLDDGRVTTWKNLRPSCWLSAVPGSGMLLAPEGGGGCSCGRWMETSIAFGPWGE